MTDQREEEHLDQFIRSYASEFYQASEAFLPRASPPVSEDLCPLYTSMLQVADRYQYPELVGCGGMKRVYRVFDERTARYVAMAKPLETHQEDRFDAFLREAHLTAKLEHPCIIQVFDMGVDKQNRPFFTMEFKKGNSLRELIQKMQDPGDFQISIAKRLEIFMRICDAIAYAHSQRVLHLDIKPGNIQIGAFGEVQVCDWGLGEVMPSKDASEDSSYLLDPDLYGPSPDQGRGTPLYMSPEQSNPRQKKTAQMDIFALGCVLYEVLTGQKFQDRLSNRDVISGLACIIDKATAKSADQRYQSVNEMQDDLERFRSNYSTSVEKPNLIREVGLFWKRHVEACRVMTAAALLIGTLLAFFIYQMSQKEQFAVTAKLDAEKARVVAETAMEEAEVAEKQAKDLLVKYKEELKESERLLDALMHSHEKLESTQHLAQKFFAAQGASKNVHRSIQYYSNLIDRGVTPNSRVWEYLCWWNFIAQDFNACLEVSQQTDSLPKDMITLARNFALRLNRDGYLDTDDMIELVGALKNRSLLCERLLSYDQQFSRPASDRVRIIASWIKLHNQSDQNRIHLDYDAETQTVRLRGPVKQLRLYYYVGINASFNINFLQPFDPLVVDLQQTAISSLNQCLGLKPVEIDIRQTAISDLRLLHRFRSLQILVVEPGQFKQAELSNVPAWTTIVQRPVQVGGVTESPVGIPGD